MSDMKLQMIITGNNRGLDQVLRNSDDRVRQFTQGAGGHFAKLQGHIGKVMQSINGLSAASTMIGIGGGMLGMKSIIDDNLAFERTLLRTRFNAQATTKDLVELRRMAMDLSKTTLNTPLEVAEMQFRLATSGLKMPDIRQLAPKIAAAAQVFEAPAGEIANLVFDKITKMGITNDRVPQMLDMLYYHATSGRFETVDMARQAPELLNAGALVGLNNEKGLNLMGALTQRMMRNTTVSNPAEVATLVKHGLSHITDPHYVTKLGKAGIDVKSFFDDKGKFKGEGGVDGLLGLTRAMMAKGFENPFKLGQAGFREQYTRTFWLEMMRSLRAKDTEQDPNLIKMMERGNTAMGSGQLEMNLATIKESNFGKIKAAEIEVQKLKLSEAGQGVTSAAGSAAKTFSEHPAIATAGAIAAVAGGKYLWSKLGSMGQSGVMGKLAGGLGAAGAVPVFVTNWPGGGFEKASTRMERIIQGGTAGAAGTAVAGISGAAVVSALAGAAIVAVPAAMVYGVHKWLQSDSGQASRSRGITLEMEGLQRRLNSEKSAPKEMQDKYTIDKLENQIKLMKSDRDAIIRALASRPVEVHIDGQKVADVVNKANGRDARRQ